MMRKISLLILSSMILLTMSCGDPDPPNNTSMQCSLIAEDQRVEIDASGYAEIFEADAQDPPTHIRIHSAPPEVEVEVCNHNSDRSCAEGSCETGECPEGTIHAVDRDGEAYCLVDCSDGTVCGDGRECDSRDICTRQACTDDTDCSGSSTCTFEDSDICTTPPPAAAPPGGEICTEDQDCRSCYSAPLGHRISVEEPSRFFRSEPGTIQYSTFQCQEYS